MENKEKYSNEYLKKCDLDNIDIWELQQSLKDRDMVELDFEDDTWIVITKNEIYVKSWGPYSMPTGYFNRWNADMYEDYEHTDYIHLECENYDNTNWLKMIKRLYEKCNYTLLYGKKEDIIKEIEQYL